MTALPSAEAEACRRLWVAVLAQAAHDVLAPAPRAAKSQGGAQAVRDAARAWLRTREFGTVCALAGIAPDTAQRRIEGLRADMDMGVRDWAGVVAGTSSAVRERGNRR